MTSKRARCRRVARALVVLAALGSSLLLWGFVIEPGWLRNEDYELALPGWPEACDGLRVAVLSDLHVGSPFNGLDKLPQIVALTLAANPDLVLLAGDYVITDVPGGRFVSPEQIADGLRKLTVPLGVHAVLGNHDWWLDGPRVRLALESVGIPVLEDAATRIAAGPCSFWLVGIGDYWETPHRVRRALFDVRDAAPVLAFTHNPDVFPEVPARVNLTIAGHTHGGQVWLPGLGRLVVPSRYGERYAIGHIVEAGRHFFVSSGLGTSVLPVRFLVPPEVSVITLRAD
jgi:predicted MPP superfamily phosphohydrolase